MPTILAVPPVPAGVDDHPQTVANRLEFVGIDLDLRLRRRRRHWLPAAPVVDGLEKVGRHPGAPVGERGHVDGHRDRRHGYLPLANAHRNGLPWVPFLVAHALLPLCRGHEALHFVRQIDSAHHAEAEQRGPLVDLVDADHVRHSVEIHVARLFDGMPQVDGAVAAFLPALERPTPEHRAAGAVDVEVRRDDAFLERGEPDRHLECRTGGISSLRRAVVQRALFVRCQTGPRRAIDAGRKCVRVVSGPAGKCEDVAVGRVEDDGSAGIGEARARGRIERVLHGFLKVVVDGELQPLTLGRLVFVERANLASHAVDDDAPGAVLALEQRVVHLLHAGLADDVAALEGVVLGHLRVADLADVPEQVRANHVGIAPRRHLLDDDVRQFEVQPVRDDCRDLRQRGVLDDRDRPVGRFAPVPVDDGPHAGLVEADDRGERADGVVQILGVLADDRDAVRMPVLDHHTAVAVEHEAARRAPRERALVVVLGQFLELRVLHHLQHPEAHGQQGEQHRDHELETAQPLVGLATLLNCHLGGLSFPIACRRAGQLSFCAAGFYRRNRVFAIRRRSTAPGSSSTS